LAGLAAALDAPIPFANALRKGIFPEAIAQAVADGLMDGKRGLRILNDRPLNAETPVTLLDDLITPNTRHFVRNNGLIPERALRGSLDGWSLVVDGEVDRPLNLSLDHLKKDFEHHTRALVLECGGNGRAGFHPPTSGNQWTLGAVGCSLYEGVLLRDVLARAGVRSSAVYLAFVGEDPHLSRDPSKSPISRGVPIAKALDEHCLLAWNMNGVPLPALHGFPLRLICPGWPASASGKWLTRLWVRDQVHDGEKMTGTSYRMPRYPVAPGTVVPDADMEIIEELPVKSIVTNPGTGMTIELNESLDLRGHAWSGFGEVRAMDVSIDFGATWLPTLLYPPRNPFAWQRWETSVRFPTPGYYEVWARATDVRGHSQPMVVPGWNPRGYLNNAMQRIAVKVS
jgi:DMSO/TMAO reductase YedYZ molybdopterin-dependent catalytic subunit